MFNSYKRNLRKCGKKLTEVSMSPLLFRVLMSIEAFKKLGASLTFLRMEILLLVQLHLLASIITCKNTIIILFHFPHGLWLPIYTFWSRKIIRSTFFFSVKKQLTCTCSMIQKPHLKHTSDLKLYALIQCTYIQLKTIFSLFNLPCLI